MNFALQDLRFGVEIETAERNPSQVTRTIADHYRGSPSLSDDEEELHWEDCDDDYCEGCRDTPPTIFNTARGHRWECVYDGSVNSNNGRHAEIRTPVYNYRDIPELQEVVRSVRGAGSEVNRSCGIHIHVDGNNFHRNPRGVRNLAMLVYHYEPLFEQAFNRNDRWNTGYCGRMNTTFYQRLRDLQSNTLTLNQVTNITSGSGRNGLNLGALTYDYRNTIEYRWFYSTLHAGKVKALVQFALALTAYSLSIRNPTGSRMEGTHRPRERWERFIRRIGLVGNEFRTARQHLLNGFPAKGGG